MIATDANGKASVVITMPARSTSWKLRAKGVDDGSLAGQAEAEVLTKKDLFAEMKLPSAFVSGDTATIPVEIHNSLDGAREIVVTLKTTIGEKSRSESQTIDVAGPGITKINFETEADGDAVEFELSVSSGEFEDLTRQTLVVHPDGFPVYATASGNV